MNIHKSLCAAALLLLCAASASALPRSEYPRPQFERASWVNLNGEWTYSFDPVKTGHERKLMESKGFDGKIIVPFAPESKLSGVEHKEFIPCIWYHRQIEIPAEWGGKDVLLNFGAVYYESEVYIDGKIVCRHFGGSDSFSVDITKNVKAGGVHSLVVRAVSDLRSGKQSAGKQCMREHLYGCNYTRTTGIWQTVWMEAVDPCGIERVQFITDIDRSQVSMEFVMRRASSKNQLTVEVLDGEKVVASQTGPVASGSVFTLPIKKAKLWSPSSPFLYTVRLAVKDSEGKVLDSASSYFGMRKIHSEGNRIFLNNEPCYQRLVLDQGFYPDGIWTAPSDEALRRDIELSMAAGFNGARLHQKVFEERFYYWADKLGYLTWGEAPSWGFDANNAEAARNYLAEWKNLVVRDINHPSIVTWTPFNEQFWPDEREYPRFICDIYDITKQLDPTRLVNTVSGGVHVKTDIWTEHNYEQDPDVLSKKIHNNGRMYVHPPMRIITREVGNIGFNSPIVNDPYDFPRYDGTIPYILDEFGGIKCMEANPAEGEAWGYGDAAKTKEDFYERLERQVKGLVAISGMWGFCYTQLTDVFQEQNGIYYFDRGTKYDMERVRAIFQMPRED